jgi:hypothetical protein
VEPAHQPAGDGGESRRLRGNLVRFHLAPDQALARIKAATADYMPIVQRLTGGLPLDRAWRCMELFGEVMGRV